MPRYSYRSKITGPCTTIHQFLCCLATIRGADPLVRRRRPRRPSLGYGYATLSGRLLTCSADCQSAQTARVKNPCRLVFQNLLSCLAFVERSPLDRSRRPGRLAAIG
jgi:hypothetical protein